jgi:hypothetical protein
MTTTKLKSVKPVCFLSTQFGERERINKVLLLEEGVIIVCESNVNIYFEWHLTL